MHDQSNQSVSVKVPAVQFESNKDFQTKGILHEGDSGFLRYRHKLINSSGDTQTNREILTTLLTTQGDNANDCVEKLMTENISYRDLASLTPEDLELMGFSRPKQKNELLQFFCQLPNQNPSLEQIYHLKEASNYNRQIINSASSHLESMRSALAAATYKLQIMPPEDVIVGEKSFASRFVLEALNELCDVTDGIEEEISEIEDIIYEKLKSTDNTNKLKRSASFFHIAAWLILGSLTSFGAMFALYLWKYKK